LVNDICLNAQNVDKGFVVFQAIGNASSKIIENLKTERPKSLFCLRDLLPNISLDTLPRFLNHIKMCVRV
jgi:hypothetical protein